jgi:hypothetical protein
LDNHEAGSICLAFSNHSLHDWIICTWQHVTQHVTSAFQLSAPYAKSQLNFIGCNVSLQMRCLSLWLLQLLSKLQSLRSLTLEYTTADYEFISSNALLPLAACSQLTYLAVDSLTVEAPAAGSAQRQLTSLRSLAIGVNGVADYRVPLSTFAPYLTALTDVSGQRWRNRHTVA